FEMDTNTSIDGGGKSITVNVPFGNMVMHGTAAAPESTDKCADLSSPFAPTVPPAQALGAQITSTPADITTVVTINVGNISAVPPTGSFVMERCSLIDVDNRDAGGQKKPAGTVVITVGHDVDIDGLVLSESTLTGGGSVATQQPGGGPIFVRAGCS